MFSKKGTQVVHDINTGIITDNSMTLSSYFNII